MHLLRISGQPTIPSIKLANANKRFSKEAKERFTALSTQINSVVTTITAALVDAKVPKTKQAGIIAPLTRLEQELRSNLPFMADQFAETMEKIVSEAKSVVESYALEQGLTTAARPTLLSDV